MAQFDRLVPEDAVIDRTRAIFAMMLRIIESAPKEIALFLVVTAGLGIAFDLQGLVESWWITLLNIANTAMAYIMISGMLRHSGLAPDGLAHGFGTYFGIGILSGLGTIVGLLLLIVPGVVLLVRWSAAYGFGLTGGNGVSHALSRSWEETGPHFWPILLALILPAGILLAGAAIYAAPASLEGTNGFVAIVLGNILMMGNTVVSSAIGLAIYGLIAAPGDELHEVFA